MKREEVRELLCRIPFEVDGHGPTAVFCGRSAITVEIRGAKTVAHVRRGIFRQRFTFLTEELVKQ